MLSNDPPLLRIYSQCLVLINYKRTLFQKIQIQVLPTSILNQQKRMSSTKVFICLKKLVQVLQRQFKQLLQIKEASIHVSFIQKLICKLKNNSQLLTNEERLIGQAELAIQNWQKIQDPTIYYEIKERCELKQILESKLKQLQKSTTDNKQSKKPLYIRKLQRELRDNLQEITDKQRNYNQKQVTLITVTAKKMRKLMSKLFEAVSLLPRESLVQDQKNELLKKYIDVFNSKTAHQSEKELSNYRRDIKQTLVKIQQIFTEEKKCLMLLIRYSAELQEIMKSVQKRIDAAEEQLLQNAMNISQDINCIVSFQDSLETVAKCKKYLILFQELGRFRQKLGKTTIILDESIAVNDELMEKIQGRDNKNKVNPVELFIQDKKTMEILVKKENQFEVELSQSFLAFLQKIYRNIDQNSKNSFITQQNSKIRTQKVFQTLFTTYFQQTEAYQKRNNSKLKGSNRQQQTLSLKSTISKRITEIQSFIKTLFIFDYSSFLWTDYYQCSLGPKLLLHGKLQILANGIYYESIFNKRNIFFGKTKIFIPKQQIFQINKEIAFVIFPDVIEIATKKGSIYFHALGKRQMMFQKMNESFFPEVNTNTTQAQFQFNQYLGNQKEAEDKVKDFISKLQYQIQIGNIPNCTLRQFFYKYFSNQEFIYKGKTYKDFKYYTVQVAEGTNIKGTDFTPGIPYYLQLASPSTLKQTSQELFLSQRYFTYGKSVPMIPLVSKGGQGICQQKSIFHWGGPHCLIIQIFTTLSGFSLTEGMLVKSRQVFRQINGSLNYEMSGCVTFEQNSAINGILRNPALSNLKSFLQTIFQVIRKLQKNKRTKGIGKKYQAKEQQIYSQNIQLIQSLQKQVQKLRKILVWTIISFAVLYFTTLLFLSNIL